MHTNAHSFYITNVRLGYAESSQRRMSEMLIASLEKEPKYMLHGISRKIKQRPEVLH